MLITLLARFPAKRPPSLRKGKRFMPIGHHLPLQPPLGGPGAAA